METKKLSELNGWELMGRLADLAEPIGNLTNDDLFWDTFTECTKRGVSLKQKDGLRFILKAYGKLIPILMGEDHRKDTIRILAAVEGKSVPEAMKMNGKQLFQDFLDAYKENIEPFFTRSALSEKIG